MTFLNVAHLHLLLNHFPTVALVIGVGLFLLALVRRNDQLQRASLEVFFVITLVTLPAYLTGVAARAAIEDRPGVSQAATDAHHDAALLAFLFMQITGLMAWLALWQKRRRLNSARWTPAAVLLLALVTFVMMTSAATLGGEIRHPEIRIDENAVPVRGWLSVASIAAFVTNTPWVWPAAETLHFLGLSLLFGVLAVVNLRILGFIKGVPFTALHRLLPWAVLAFGINMVTGMLFFISAADQYIESVPFYWKIALMVAAGGNVLYLTVAERVWTLESEDEAPFAEKAIAASGIGLWVAVMYLGRMLPFLGTSF